MRLSFTLHAGLIGMAVVLVMVFAACAMTNSGMSKGGGQLWGENCLRCHNLPDPTSFEDDQWETIGRHMQLRANLTSKEIDEIVEFLQSAN